MEHAMKNIDPAELVKYPAPRWTDTWHPVSHDRAFHETLDSLEDLGVEVIDTRVDLTCLTKRMFCTFEIPYSGDMRYFVGLRNSYDKSFGLGVCAGQRIMVCSNLRFSGEFMEVRRHTRGLDYESMPDMLLSFVENAVQRTIVAREWLEGLKMVMLDEQGYAYLTILAMEVNALSPRQFHQFRNLYSQKYKTENGSSVYAWHEALTECARNFNLETISRKTSITERIIDSYIVRRRHTFQDYTMTARLGKIPNPQMLLAFDDKEETEDQ